jgi:predicted small lipoprotein YifL
MKNFKRIAFVVVCSSLLGCAGFTQDWASDNWANEFDSWAKQGSTKEMVLHDIKACGEKTAIQFPPKKIPDTPESIRAHESYYQSCMLSKGYKFYPRGTDGKHTSYCRFFDNQESPACKSVRWWD